MHLAESIKTVILKICKKTQEGHRVQSIAPWIINKA